jgi:hypothetical protein
MAVTAIIDKGGLGRFRTPSFRVYLLFYYDVVLFVNALENSRLP